MDKLNRTVYPVMGTLLVVMIISSSLFRCAGDNKPGRIKSPAKYKAAASRSVDDFPDRSRIPTDNLKTK